MNIYIITNKVNNKQYIGLTTRTIYERFRSHLYAVKNGVGHYLHNAIRKYGEENFKLELLDTANDLETLKEKEIYYIAKYDTFNNGYNLTKGGDFSSNSGFVVVQDVYGNIFRITTLEFIERDDVISVNKNKITVYKDSEKKRISTHEYKTKYFQEGWRSKNYGFVTVKQLDGSITKIPSKDFDKNIHTGIKTGTQTYFDIEINKFVSLLPKDVDLTKHYNKQKVRYLVKDEFGEIKQIVLNIDNIKIEFGFRQFRYLIKRNKNFSRLEITKEVLEKLKIKCRDYSLLGFVLIKEQI